jgi:DmsE family decaheme c-type cytochrome
MTIAKRAGAFIALGLAIWFAPFAGSLAAEPAAGAGEYAGGVKTCLKCHDKDQHKAVLHTPHAQMADPRTPFAENSCEGCHGPSAAHVNTSKKDQEGEKVPIHFGRNSHTPVEKQNEVCLDCHRGGDQMHWEGSSHRNGDIPCAACHDSHAINDRVLERAEQAEVCFACHTAQRAKSNLLSRHPTREGKIACSDCHLPHGGFGPSQLVGSTVNDTCYTCHAEKRGPFLWEHAPVREDCTLCHSPHGSTQPSMLKMRGPWLCQTCHSWTFHPSNLYDANSVPPLGMDNHTVFRNCLNCHPMVHGSNHPSGVRFTR